MPLNTAQSSFLDLPASAHLSKLWEHSLFFRELLKAPSITAENPEETTPNAAEKSLQHMLLILADSNHPVHLSPIKTEEDIIDRVEQLHHHYLEEILHTISEKVIYNKNIDESIRTLASRPPPSPDTFVIEVLTDDNEPETDSLKVYLCKVLLKQENPVAARCILATLKSSYRKALALIEFVKTQPTQENIQEARNTIATLRCPFNKATALIEFVKVQPTPENIQEARSILTTFSGRYESAAVRALVELIKVQATQENIQTARNFIATTHEDPYNRAGLLIELVKVCPTHEIIHEVNNLIATIDNPAIKAMSQIELVEAHPTPEILHDARNIIMTINNVNSKAQMLINLVKAHPTQEIIQGTLNTIATCKDFYQTHYQSELIKVLLTQENFNVVRSIIATINDPIEKAKALDKLTEAEEIKNETLQLIAPSHPKDKVPIQVKRAQIAMLQGNLKEARRVIANIGNLSEKAQAQIACFEILFTHPSAIKPISSATSEIGIGPAGSGLSVFPPPILSKAPPSQPALSK